MISHNFINAHYVFDDLTNFFISSFYNIYPLKSHNLYEDNLIVSLTSYGQRLKTCHLAIKSILNQTVKPRRVLLFIGEESRDVVLPKSLLALKQYNVDIIYVSDNLKGHKKYFYSMQMYPESVIITIDDDCIYPANTIECLLKAHKQFPKAVVARRVHKITCKNNHVTPYSQWKFEYMPQHPHPDHSLLAVGVGGVLYPPAFGDTDLYDTDAIKCFALDADDIWLKFYELKHNIKIVWAKNMRPHPYTISSTKKDGLYLTNLKNNQNDVVIQQLEQYFSLNLEQYVMDDDLFCL